MNKKQKYRNKFLDNTSIQLENVWILLYLIYWFYAKDKSLLNYTNFFSPKEYENDDKIIPNIFHN